MSPQAPTRFHRECLPGSSNGFSAVAVWLAVRICEWPLPEPMRRSWLFAQVVCAINWMVGAIIAWAAIAELQTRLGAQ